MIEKYIDAVRFEVLSWYLLCGAQESHKIPQPPTRFLVKEITYACVDMQLRSRLIHGPLLLYSIGDHSRKTSRILAT
jgi:hypothetical protein